MNPNPKRSTLRSEKYLAFIRRLPCLICNKESVAHHEPLGGAGLSIKCDDSRGCPLCVKHHSERHQTGFKTFWDKYRIAPEMEIIRLLTDYLKEQTK